MNRMNCMNRGRLLPSALVLALAAAAAAQPNATPAQAPPTPAEVAGALRLGACSVVTVRADPTPGLAQRVQVPIEGKVLTLDLTPHSVRAPGFILQEQRADGSFRAADPGPVNTLRGTVVGDEGSKVAGGVMPEGLYCTIVLGDGRQFWLEPLTGRVARAGKADYVVYANGSGRAGGFCGTTDDQRLQGDHADQGGGAQPGLRGATLWTAQLATDADVEFYQDYGGTTNVNSRISLVTNTMNLQYERDVNITHTISVTRVRTVEPDPYSSTVPATLNTQVTAAWTGDAFTKDVIILYTGKEMDGSVIGRANAIGSICNSQNSNCFVQSDYNNNFGSACDLSAHELGHLWDGSHCTCTGPESTMNPSITSINRFGVNTNDTADTDIPAYRNSRACLTTSAPGVSPANNTCADAVRLLPGTFAFNTFNATTDGPAVLACDGAATANNDIWYSYVAPCDGTLTVQTCVTTPETSFDTVLVAYTGSCASLVQVACDDDTDPGCGSGNRQSRIAVSVDAGVTYRLRVGGFTTTTGIGILTVSQTSCPAPANNACAAATTIQHNLNYAFSTYGATTDGPIEAADCAGSGDNTIGKDIWYRITAPCAGTLRVSTCGSSFDTRLGIYASCPGGPGAILACNDDNGPACGGTRSSLDFAATADTSYLIRLGGYNNTQGVGTLRVDALVCPPPDNDLCANATPIGVGSILFSNSSANTDGPSEPADCNFFGEPQIGKDIWYRLNAACLGRYRFSTCGATFDSEIALYAGSCPASPNLVLVCNDDNGPACAGTRASVQSPAGFSGTIYIRVGGFGGAIGGESGIGSLVVTRVLVVDCVADGLVQPNDVACFVNQWFTSLQNGTLTGDWDLNGAVTPSDVAGFVSAWFAALTSAC